MNKTLLFNNQIIHYNIQGKGLPIILIHGFGEDYTIWNFQTEQLSKKYLIISIDLPGSGGSEKFKADEIDISDFIYPIKAVLNYENINTCVMLGHSMGGYIVLAYHEKYPEDLLGMGLIHSTALNDSEERMAIRKKSISFIEQNDTYAFLKTSIPGLFHNRDEHYIYINSLFESGSKINKTTLIQYYKAIMKRPNCINLLDELNIPLLFISGKHDQHIPLKVSLHHAYLAKITHFHIMKESAHMGMIEEIEKTTNSINAFLEYITEITIK